MAWVVDTCLLIDAAPGYPDRGVRRSVPRDSYAQSKRFQTSVPESRGHGSLAELRPSPALAGRLAEARQASPL